MQKILGVVLALTLVGCAGDHQRFTQGYPLLVGKNINQVATYLGTPDSEQTILGQKVYEWHNTSYGAGRGGSAISSSVFTGYGSRHSHSGIGLGTTFGDSPTTVAYDCALKVVTNRKGVITESSYRGSASGCAKFGKGIAALTNPQQGTFIQ
ncbi:MAG: hypothetical protein V4621_06700 [Pseudomonadota bacterium]